MRFKSIVVTATAPLCKTENMAVGEVSASPPLREQKKRPLQIGHLMSDRQRPLVARTDCEGATGYRTKRKT